MIAPLPRWLGIVPEVLNDDDFIFAGFPDLHQDFGDFIDSPDQVLTLALPAKLRVHNSLCDIQKVFFGFFGWVGYLGDEVTDVEIKLRVTSFEPIRARAFRTRFQLLLSALGLFGSASLFDSFLDIDDGRPTDQRFIAGPVILYGCLDLPSGHAGFISGAPHRTVKLTPRWRGIDYHWGFWKAAKLELARLF